MKFFDFFRKKIIGTFIENILVILTRGKSPNSFWGKFVPGNHLYDVESFKEFTFNDIKMTVDLHDWMGHYYYYGFKDENIDKLFSLVKENFVIVDVGANIGYTTLNFAKRIGSNGTVYSFEPDPLNHERCLKNIKLNQYQNIKLIKKGLGSISGSFNLEIATENNRGGNRINQSSEIGDYNIIEVTTLDSEIPDGLSVNLIKIDVEGFELEVLKGASKILKQFHPIVFCEINDSNLMSQGETIENLVNFMKEVGYNKIIDASTGRNVSLKHTLKNIHTDFIFEKSSYVA